MRLHSLVVVVCLGVVGCVSRGTVSEKAPVTQDLGSFKTATISIAVAEGIENPDVYKSQLSNYLEADLKEQHLFTDVPASGGDLTIKVSLATLEKPSGFAAATGGGSSEGTGTVELIDTKASKSLGAFDMTANSKQQVRTSVNGVDTKTGEDPRKRVMIAAADQIAAYIASHRAGAK